MGDGAMGDGAIGLTIGEGRGMGGVGLAQKGGGNLSGNAMGFGEGLGNGLGNRFGNAIGVGLRRVTTNPIVPKNAISAAIIF
jgi:hypothetical protein